MKTFPKILQIEPTTHCNFHCKMCIRRSWNEKITNFPLDLFESLARQHFSKLYRVIFMGIGEVLTHPHFLKFVEIAAKYLPDNGKIEFSTNGSLLTPEITDKILQAGHKKLDRIIVSLETPFLAKLKHIRPEAGEYLFDNLKYLGKQFQQGKFSNLAIESVIMKSTLYDLPDLVSFCSKIPIKSLYITHILPHTPEMVSETLYSTTSSEVWSMGKEFVEESWNAQKKSIINLALKPAYGEFSEERKILGNYLLFLLQSFRDKSFSSGLSVNFDKIIQVSQKFEILQDVTKIFSQAQKIARQSNIYLELPPLFPSFFSRTCPYIKRDAAIINVHGDVIPCFNFMHHSITYVNGHMREERIKSFGNINNQDLADIWQSPQYKEFRDRLHNDHFSEKIPWCGDCPYSTANCFYTNSNESDCYGNSPGCNECLYSGDLIKCIFDP
ncbi:MAG: radical SAM protein [Promethearchaeota archaeon]